MAGEQVRPLRSLGVPDAEQLFGDRARAVAPGFALTPTNAAAVGEICRRLDGIPLAIELAAARAEVMSPVEIAELLDERFRLLTGGRRTAVERHQTLRATVDWSYSLLDERDRTVFERLARLRRFLRRECRDRAWSRVTGSKRGTSANRLLPSCDGQWSSASRTPMDSPGTRCWRRCGSTHASDSTRATTATPGAGGTPSTTRTGPTARRRAPRTRRTRTSDGDSTKTSTTCAPRSAGRSTATTATTPSSRSPSWRSSATSRRRALPAGSGCGRSAPRRAPSRPRPARRHAVLGAAAWTVVQILGDPRRGGAIARDALRDGLPPDSPAPALAHIGVAQSEGYLGSWEHAVRGARRARAGDDRLPGSGARTARSCPSSRATMLVTSGDAARATTEADAALENRARGPQPERARTGPVRVRMGSVGESARVRALRPRREHRAQPCRRHRRCARHRARGHRADPGAPR